MNKNQDLDFWTLQIPAIKNIAKCWKAEHAKQQQNKLSNNEKSNNEISINEKFVKYSKIACLLLCFLLFATNAHAQPTVTFTAATGTLTAEEVTAQLEAQGLNQNSAFHAVGNASVTAIGEFVFLCLQEFNDCNFSKCFDNQK